MVRWSGGARDERQSRYECGEGVIGEGVGGEKEVRYHAKIVKVAFSKRS